MCGIAGFADFTGNSEKSTLVKMTDTLPHRGPDAGGYYYDRSRNCAVGLGHRRLSIIDLSTAGNQPMQYKEGRYWITFNGEIYNYSEIKKALTSLGHVFHTNSDTEVILHAYHEWGVKALDQFVGMFALVIYDALEQILFCCRDRAGVKPFFYCEHEGVFLFGSELKALMAHPAFKKEIDVNAAAAFMQFGYVPAPHCIFKNTFKLKPGHYLVLNLKNGQQHISMYWNVYDCYNRSKLRISMEEAIGETEKVLEKAFSYRMVADVPVGVFLSGGYDSACLTALLQKNSTDKLKTFTIGMADKDLNEAPFAKEIAGLLGTDHHEYYCSEMEAMKIVDELPYFFDEPFGDSSAIPTILVSRIARKSVTVALSADAGDEIFGGYGRYQWMLKYYKTMNAIPALARKGSAAMLQAIPVEKIPGLGQDHIFQKKYEKLTTLLQDPSPLNVFMGTTTNYSEKEKRKLFIPEINQLFSAHYSDELQPGHFDPVTYAMAKDYQTYLADDILQKVDRATMSVSLEGREPFLDQHVIEWAGSLPPSYKIYDGQSKFILKQIVHRYLPERLMSRPKMGFTVPMASWLENGLKPLVDAYLDENYIRNQQIFSNSYVQQFRKIFYSNRKEHVYKIWFLLMFQMWYDKWIKK